MPTLFMLIGPPASGKSTWRAEMLADQSIFIIAGQPPKPRADAVVISGDDLIEEECVRTGLTYSEVFRTVDFKEQDRILRTNFMAAIAEKRDIIIDRTNLTVKSRRKWLSSLPKTYEKVGVVFNVERDVLFERLHRRGVETGKVIPVPVVEDMIASYQEPAFCEFDQVVKR